MKEGDSTEKLVESLVKELNCETVFTIPVFGGIAVDEGVVVTWIIMAVLTILILIRQSWLLCLMKSIVSTLMIKRTTL